MEEFEKIEYEQAYSFFKTSIQEFFKVLTVLVVANATIIGIAIQYNIHIFICWRNHPGCYFAC